MAATSILHMDQIDQLDPLVLGSLLLELKKKISFHRFIVQKIKHEPKLKQTFTILYTLGENFTVSKTKYTMGYTFY